MYTVQFQPILLEFSQCLQNPLLLGNNQISQFICTVSQRNKLKFKIGSIKKPCMNQLVLQNSSGCGENTRCSAGKASNGFGRLSPWSAGFKQGLRARVKSSESVVAGEEDDDFDKEAEEAKESEEEARKTNWVKRGWAPWELLLTPEADFALKSLEEAEGETLETPEAVEAFKRLTPKLQQREEKKTWNSEPLLTPQQMKITAGDEEIHLLPRTSQWGEPEPNETVWNGPAVFTLIPPRDWPPPGWKVDPQELAFIREAHKLEAVRVDPQALEKPMEDASQASFPRFEMFMKQYKEWVAANKERLDSEALEVDYDYHPGRRRTGSNYVEGMYELPFVYPGQIYSGYVTSVNLYEGAFVFIGCIHDGWVPIRSNDWFWVRQHIKVGMHVQVEVLAKRDPYRFRFPIELRFVNPNIDHLIFKRFEYPPIFGRDDTNYDELARETRRPYYPRRRPDKKPEDQPLLRDHPYHMKIWQIHVSEQAVLDEEENATTAKEEEDDNVDELETENKVYDSDDDGYWVWGHLEGIRLPKLILTTDEKDLEIDAAREERKVINRLREEAEAQGTKFVSPKLRRQKQMDELDEMHKRRSIEQREALIRDNICRLELGLPIEEPGKYVDDSFWGKNRYDPRKARCRSDYWGDPKDLKSDSTKKSVSKDRGTPKKEVMKDGMQDDFAKASWTTATGNKPLVNGTESLMTGNVQGMFDQPSGNNDKEGKDSGSSDKQDE